MLDFLKKLFNQSPQPKPAPAPSPDLLSFTAEFTPQVPLPTEFEPPVLDEISRLREDIAAMQSRILELEARDTKAADAADAERDRVICALWAGRKHSQRSIAKLFNVSRSVVRHVIAAYCVTIKVNGIDVIMPSNKALTVDIYQYAHANGIEIDDDWVIQHDDVQMSYPKEPEETIELYKGMTFTAYNPHAKKGHDDRNNQDGN